MGAGSSTAHTTDAISSNGAGQPRSLSLSCGVVRQLPRNDREPWAFWDSNRDGLRRTPPEIDPAALPVRLPLGSAYVLQDMGAWDSGRVRSSNTPELETRRLMLAPLQVADAHEMVDVLADPELYGFIGGEPPSLRDLQARYRSQFAGPAADDEVWHNWILRLKASGRPIGFVQAAVTRDTADVAWVVGTDWQRRGFASEAAVEMCRWLRQVGLGSLTAHNQPDHVASERVAAAAGLGRTAERDADGEIVWAKT